ncbi:hypothetical protein N7516_004127 [Penicillium verrucosum]|uniref:uncharacterized protein n=1 Tax=Penicillium verrucosum TaxID=60171 RepID=UPI00254553DA|nr:uncharacterized protein N7516_004127 [Penicillium verrucosum]KAJ5943959.1 hypothetical protein N7516_004127 [Penicillium verrucosum]
MTQSDGLRGSSNQMEGIRLKSLNQQNSMAKNMGEAWKHGCTSTYLPFFARNHWGLELVIRGYVGHHNISILFLG